MPNTISLRGFACQRGRGPLLGAVLGDRCLGDYCLSRFPAQAVYLPGSWDFRIRSTESIVFQLRVVTGAPKSLSIWPRQPMVFMRRRYTPYTRRFFEPMIRTSHSPPSGRAIGRETPRRPAFDRMLTN